MQVKWNRNLCCFPRMENKLLRKIRWIEKKKHTNIYLHNRMSRMITIKGPKSLEEIAYIFQMATATVTEDTDVMSNIIQNIFLIWWTKQVQTQNDWTIAPFDVRSLAPCLSCTRADNCAQIFNEYPYALNEAINALLKLNIYLFIDYLQHLPQSNVNNNF